MKEQIVLAQPEDLPIIFTLFERAIAFQKANNYVGWKSFDENFVRKDVEDRLLYKLSNEEDIIAFFSICYHDELIWQEKEKGDALYLHRMVLNQNYKGKKVFEKFLFWSLNLAKAKKLQYIRMDTWAENEKLIGYYKRFGFEHVKDFITSGSTELPLQHRNLNVALLELKLSA